MVFVGELFQAPDKDAPRLVEHLGFHACGNQAEDLVLQGLAIHRSVFIENHQVHRQTFHPPIGVGLEELLDEFDSGGVADAEQNDRRIAGDAIAPEAALAAAVVEQHAGSGAPGGVGINQVTRQPGIKLGVGFGGVEVAQGDLAVGPREIQGPVGHARVVVFFHAAPGPRPGFRSCP